MKRTDGAMIVKIDDYKPHLRPLVAKQLRNEREAHKALLRVYLERPRLFLVPLGLQDWLRHNDR